MSELTFEEFCAQPLLYAGGMSGDYGAHRAYRNDKLGIQKEVVTERKKYGDIYSGWVKGKTYYFLDGDPRTFNNEAELYEAWMGKICGMTMNKCTRCGEVNPAEIHTCSPQTKVQRLADTLERMVLSTKWDKEAATELRRLDALNAELVEALERLVDIYYDGGPLPVGEIDKVEAALAKAKEQT